MRGGVALVCSWGLLFWGGHAASAVGEDGVGVAVHGHDGGVSQKSVYEA